MTHRADRRPDRLSGGERRRVGIAQASSRSAPAARRRGDRGAGPSPQPGDRRAARAQAAPRPRRRIGCSDARPRRAPPLRPGPADDGRAGCRRVPASRPGCTCRASRRRPSPSTASSGARCSMRRDLLARGLGQAPSLAEVGARSGSRPVERVRYVRSRDGLLEAVVADIFPAWTEQDQHRDRRRVVARREGVGHVETNVGFFTEVRAARRAAGHAPGRRRPAVLHGPLQDFTAPLRGRCRRCCRTSATDPDVRPTWSTRSCSTARRARTRRRASTDEERAAILAPRCAGCSAVPGPPGRRAHGATLTPQPPAETAAQLLRLQADRRRRAKWWRSVSALPIPERSATSPRTGRSTRFVPRASATLLQEPAVADVAAGSTCGTAARTSADMSACAARRRTGRSSCRCRRAHSEHVRQVDRPGRRRTATR